MSRYWPILIVFYALLLAALPVGRTILAATPTPAANTLLAQYLAEQRSAQSEFGEFDARRGETLYRTQHRAADGTMRSCALCHMADPRQPGQTDLGKPIEPLAPTVNPKRFQDTADIEKWFRRNCRWVLGRECTAGEKGDFLEFIFSK